jgi:hypothetical protein
MTTRFSLTVRLLISGTAVLGVGLAILLNVMLNSERKRGYVMLSTALRHAYQSGMFQGHDISASRAEHRRQILATLDLPERLQKKFEDEVAVKVASPGSQKLYFCIVNWRGRVVVALQTDGQTNPVNLEMYRDFDGVEEAAVVGAIPRY